MSASKQAEPPQHAFELRIRIGGNDWDYVVRTMHELAEHIEQHGPECSLASGGWDGAHSVDIQRREVTPDQYRTELQEWMEVEREEERHG